MALTNEISDAASLARLAEGSGESTRPLVPFAPPTFPSVVARPSRRARTKRLIFINRFFFPDVSATSQILFDLARRLVQQGIEVHVICSGQLYDDPSARLPAREIVHGIHVHRAWTSRFGRDRLAGRSLDYASFYVSGAAKLFALLRKGDVVIAKTDPPLISIAAAAAARVRGARLINWLQDVFPEVASQLGANPLPGWLDKALKRLRDQSLAMAQVNVVLGSRMREHLEGRRIPTSRIKVIENWADGSAVVPMAVGASRLRQTLGLENKFVIGYSGNLGRAHEFETILAAAERLKNEQDVVFLMIGGGAKMEQLRRCVLERNLENFRFLPYQPRERLSDSLAAADVHLACLLPNLEGLIVPSKCYGVLAAGRPLIFIGDADGEVARIVREKECGRAVQMGDAAALVRTITELRGNLELREKIGLRARELFIDCYTVERATIEWLQVLSAPSLETAA